MATVRTSPGIELGVYVLVAPEPDRQQPHEDDEVYVVLEGSGVLEIEGETVELKEGQAAFVPAAAARGDARHEHAVPDLQTPGLDDRADGLVPEDRPRPALRYVALRMCRSVPQVVEESMRTTTSVGTSNVGSGTSSQDRCPGP